MLRNPKIIVAAAALFILSFVFGLLWTAPMDVVSRIVESRLEAATDHALSVDIGHARLRGPTSIVLRDVRIRTTPDPHAEDSAPIPMTIDRIRVRASLFSVLRGSPNVRGDARINEGEIRFRYGAVDDIAHEVQCEIAAVELRDLHPLRDLLGLPVQGRIEGEILLQYDEDRLLQGGSIDFAARNTVLGPGDIRADAFEQFGGAIPIPATRVGDIDIAMSMDGPSVQIDRFEGRGEDVRLDIGGTLQMRTPLANSQLRMTLTFGLSEEYVEEAGIGPALNMWPVLEQAQTGDQYALLISGTLGDLPEPQPLRGGSRP